MKSYFLAFVVLILAVDAVKALECYQCEYLEGADVGDVEKEDWFDKSCKSGKKPNKKLTVTCPAGYDVCSKAFLEGKLDTGENVKDTIRGCGIRNRFPGYTSDKCENKNSSELSGLIGSRLPDNFKGSVCLCSDDKCNSSSMVKVTQGLMVLALGVFSTKFMGLF